MPLVVCMECGALERRRWTFGLNVEHEPCRVCGRRVRIMQPYECHDCRYATVKESYLGLGGRFSVWREMCASSGCKRITEEPRWKRGKFWAFIRWNRWWFIP